MHKTQLEAINEDPVNHESLLMGIRHFDICSGALVSDIMHDLIEGVIQLETKLMLPIFIENCYFSLEILNRNIEYLELPNEMESDKPAPLDRKTIYSQSNCLVGLHST